MNELIKVISNEQEEQLVSGRELHEFLNIGTKYEDWFPRMAEYGFIENEDYHTLKNENMVNGRKYIKTDHALKIDMAKELSMIQRTEKGKEARTYFIQVEKAWNSPDMIMKRALQIADRRVMELELKNNQLQLDNSLQMQQIAELQPKASYYDWVLQTKDLVSVTIIAKQYGKTPQWLNTLLHEEKVQFKQGNIWLPYKKYAEEGYMKINFAPKDIDRLYPHSKWTQKGMLFIYELLKSKGILPLIEQGDNK